MLLFGAVACTHASTFATARSPDVAQQTIIAPRDTPIAGDANIAVARGSQSNAIAPTSAAREDAYESTGGNRNPPHPLELQPREYHPITLGDPCGFCRTTAFHR
jgi:hypothetical protein